MKTRVYLLTIPDKIISNDISKRSEKGFNFFLLTLVSSKKSGRRLHGLTAISEQAGMHKLLTPTHNVNCSLLDVINF